ncbi:MAG: spheroidene monooxygenase [Aestuariivita sp.]|nr:spheroidene monooxygenase [Aestuariivita sp.]MCY4346915.1 spheroidene monooxygenase [Aestuariivita sp.]
MQTVSISFFRFPTIIARTWAFTMMGAARLSLLHEREISFWKLCGSGTGEGFTPIPNTAVYAIVATWENDEVAHDRVGNSRLWQRYRRKSQEDWTVFMVPIASRGKWSGRAPFMTTKMKAHGPLAVLTRATIKTRVAIPFWRQMPDVSRAIGTNPHVIFKIGLGEVPFLHPITFSIWPDTETMVEFARSPSGPHQAAIDAVREGGWFHEDLFTRFTVTGESGSWGGGSPLEKRMHADV